jgi:hypothetical protein
MEREDPAVPNEADRLSLSSSTETIGGVCAVCAQISETGPMCSKCGSRRRRPTADLKKVRVGQKGVSNLCFLIRIRQVPGDEPRRATKPLGITSTLLPVPASIPSSSPAALKKEVSFTSPDNSSNHIMVQVMR